VPRTLYLLEGQQLRLLRSRAELAHAYLFELADNAGDVPE
jgi:hypothetical protein